MRRLRCSRGLWSLPLTLRRTRLMIRHLAAVLRQAAIIAEASALGRSNREYFRDSWNWLDVPALFLLSAGFLVRLWSTTSGNDLEQVGEALYLLVAPLLFPRILFFAQIYPSQGAMIQVRPVPKEVTLKHSPIPHFMPGRASPTRP